MYEYQNADNVWLVTLSSENSQVLILGASILENFTPTCTLDSKKKLFIHFFLYVISAFLSVDVFPFHALRLDKCSNFVTATGIEEQ